jgi:hypothetical protein
MDRRRSGRANDGHLANLGASGSQLRPGPPPAFDSAELAAELAEVKNVPRGPAAYATNRAAFFWQGVPFKTVFLWLDITHQKVFEYRWDDNPPRAARAYAIFSVAFYDAFVACFDAKYTYWAIRPFQLDLTLTTLFATPNHPSYPGAHASVSGAAGEALAYLFPRDAAYFQSQAREAADSRIWAGIHFRSDTEIGLGLGRAVARLVIERAQNDGSQ